MDNRKVIVYNGKATEIDNVWFLESSFVAFSIKNKVYIVSEITGKISEINGVLDFLEFINDNVDSRYTALFDCDNNRRCIAVRKFKRLKRVIDKNYSITVYFIGDYINIRQELQFILPICLAENLVVMISINGNRYRLKTIKEFSRYTVAKNLDNGKINIINHKNLAIMEYDDKSEYHILNIIGIHIIVSKKHITILGRLKK